MNTRKIQWKGCGIVLYVVISILLSLTITSMPAFAQQKVRVGVIVSKSGPMAFMGRDALMGYEFGIGKINDSGGIKSLGGAKLELVARDNESKPDVGMSETERLIKEEVPILMEGGVSSIGFAVTQIAEKYKTPMIVPLSVADEITERGFKYIFRLVFKASWTARDSLDFAKWLNEASGKRVQTAAILNEDTLWGESTSAAWKKMIPNYGIKLVGDFPYSSKTQDISGTISKLKAASPDVLLQCSYLNDAILITRTMQELDYNCLARITMGGHSDPRYLKNVGELGDFVFVLRMWHHTFKGPGTKIQDINQEYKKKYGEDINDWASYCYSAVMVLADALERAGSTDREKLKEALAKTNLDMATSNVIHPFPIKFDDKGQAPAISVVTQAQRGEEFAVWPAQNAAKTPLFPMPTWKERKLR